MEEHYVASVPDRLATEVLMYLNRGYTEFTTKNTTTGYTEIHALEKLNYVDSIAKRNYIFGVMDVLIMKTPY